MQLLKLLEDTPYIKKEFKRAGVDWSGEFSGFVDVYFGEGMRSAWSDRTSIEQDGAKVDLPGRVADKRPNRQESMFFIPAQRVLALRDGWPPAFNYYDGSVPFILREFSEHLRLLMSDFGAERTLFPVPLVAESGISGLAPRAYFPGI